MLEFADLQDHHNFLHSIHNHPDARSHDLQVFQDEGW